MQEVAALCDHVVVVARGRVVAEGSPAVSVSGKDGVQRLEAGDAARIDAGEEIVVQGPGHVVLWDVDGAAA